MSTTPTPTPAEILALLLPSLVASQVTRYAGIAAWTVLTYDHILTFSEEVEYFWSGEWTKSRVLFFMNRYIPHTALTWALICLTGADLSTGFCTASIRGIWIITIIGMFTAEAVLVLRIWYLYRHSPTARTLVIVCFAACGLPCIVTLYSTAQKVHDISVASYGLDIPFLGCFAPPPSDEWRVFAPILVLHTVLYFFTAYRGLHSRSVVAEIAPILMRLTRDDGILYLVIFVAVCFASIGSSYKSSQAVQLISVYSCLMLSLTATSISRIMLSIQCLTADLTSDPALLLNNNELGRIAWKRGPNVGDIIVDTDDHRRLEGAGMAMQIRYERNIEETDDKNQRTRSVSTMNSV